MPNDNFFSKVLPSWNNSLGGALSFKFRTNEPTGLIMFNRGATPGNVRDRKVLSTVDFFASIKIFT